MKRVPLALLLALSGARCSATDGHENTRGLTTSPPDRTAAGLSGTLSKKTPSATLFADNFPGQDIGAQINNAVAALPAAGGAVSFLKASYTGLRTPIRITNRRVHLFGPPDSPVLLRVAPSGNTTKPYGSHVLDVYTAAASGTVIENLHLDGAMAPSAPVNYLVSCYQASHVKVRDVLLTDSLHGGISFKECDDATVDDVVVDNVASDASASASAVSIVDSSNATVIGSTMTNNSWGIRILPSNPQIPFTSLNDVVRNNRISGIPSVGGRGVKLQYVDTSVFDGNTVESFARDGFSLQVAVTNSVFSNNIVRWNSGFCTGAGIDLWDDIQFPGAPASINNSFTANSIYENNAAGIWIGTGHGKQIVSGNAVARNKGLQPVGGQCSAQVNVPACQFQSGGSLITGNICDARPALAVPPPPGAQGMVLSTINQPGTMLAASGNQACGDPASINCWQVSVTMQGNTVIDPQMCKPMIGCPSQL